jgi:predicted AAA+ superfamily ATPase
MCIFAALTINLMVLKSEIEQAYFTQQEIIKAKVEFAPRTYLNKIKGKGSHIEVLSGIRRCGKSTLMKLLMQRIKKPIAYFNFEDARINGFEVNDFQKLDEIIGKGKAAYFFDEIQNIASWEIFVRQLHERGEKVYITGSNASLLSKELGTRLTGRHLRHELFPFSFQEFLVFKKLKYTVAAFEKYMELGGFPEYLRDPNPEVLQTLLRDIVLRDIAIRYGIKNSKTLMDLTLYLISNIGKEVSYNNLKKTFNIGSANSVSDYLTWLEDTYVLFYLPRFSWSAKSVAINPRKVYAIDNGLVNANSLSFSKDKGRLLENLVYQFLRQKQYQLFYFRENKECDFVVFEKNKCKQVIQVCSQIDGDNKARELDGLIEAMEFFKLKEGFIITLNQKDKLGFNGKTVYLIPAFEFIV